MKQINDFLRQRASDIRPSPAQRSGAKRSHRHLRDILLTGNIGRRIDGSYLSGSYQRDTAIAPLDDVDIIFEIAPSAWSAAFLSQLPAPNDVLTTFANAIRYRYDQGSRVRRQRRSVGLTMNHLHIDAVPAVPRDDRDGWIEIPDRRTGRWITSAPTIHSRLATETNKRCRGTFKPLVRLLKFWNSGLPANARFKSFAVESVALQVAAANPWSTLGQGARTCLALIAWLGGYAPREEWFRSVDVDFGGFLFPPTLRDAAGTGHNVLSGCDSDHARRFAKHAGRALRRIEDAFDAPTGRNALTLVAGVF